MALPKLTDHRKVFNVGRNFIEQYKSYRGSQNHIAYLFLFYGVECLLKACLIRQRKQSPITHDLNLLIKNVGVAVGKSCPKNLYLKHPTGSFSVTDFHSAWRYRYEIEDNCQTEMIYFLKDAAVKTEDFYGRIR